MADTAPAQAPAPGFMAPVDLEVATHEAPAPGFEAPPSRGKLRSIDDYRQYFLAEMRHPSFTQSVICEWWATTLFLFFLILSCLPGANDGQEIFRIGIVAGLMITILVYAFYAVSGGNMNPAVSLGLVSCCGCTDGWMEVGGWVDGFLVSFPPPPSFSYPPTHPSIHPPTSRP